LVTEHESETGSVAVEFEIEVLGQLIPELVFDIGGGLFFAARDKVGESQKRRQDVFQQLQRHGDTKTAVVEVPSRLGRRVLKILERESRWIWRKQGGATKIRCVGPGRIAHC